MCRRPIKPLDERRQRLRLATEQSLCFGLRKTAADEAAAERLKWVDVRDEDKIPKAAADLLGMRGQQARPDQ